MSRVHEQKARQMITDHRGTIRVRDYAAIGGSSPDGTLESRLSAMADALWDRLAPTGVSWIGFYFGPGFNLEDGRVVGPDEMLLGPCRDKPACSPIGLHGACGQAWRSREPLVVRDVRDLGQNYVACDPRDQSEVVVPFFDAGGKCLGVLDADSWEVGAFTPRDADELRRAMVRAGVSSR
ncbi:MAG TPA: hypothetical protein DEB06_01185 [Phycisphaerales bacterium]|nr:hypothetical protein [Phycisphaerales bacterium]